MTVECYSDGKYSTGEIELPVLEDAHSIQTVIRQVVQLLLQKRIERKTASLLLYGLQIASSNLKRMEEEKPQPAEVVTDPEALSGTLVEATNQDPMANEVSTSSPTNASAPKNTGHHAKKAETDRSKALPPGTVTIQASYQSGRSDRDRQSYPRKKQYVI